MFLPSCGVLADEEPSLTDTITKLDRVLASPDSQQELNISHLAFVVGEDEQRIAFLIRRLVELGALNSEDRYCCPKQHHLFTNDDIAHAQQSGELLRCPQCKKVLTGDSMIKVAVVNVVERSPYGSEAVLPDVKQVLVVTVNVALDPNELKEPLKLDTEMSRIQQRLKLEKSVVELALEFRPAASISDLRSALLLRQWSILHFSGHGVTQGLVFVEKDGVPRLATGVSLAKLVRLSQQNLKCVLLNACYSDKQAKHMAKFVTHVIGMTGKVADSAAIAFADGFYAALAQGRTVLSAFKFGCNAISLNGERSAKKPIIWYLGQR